MEKKKKKMPNGEKHISVGLLQKVEAALFKSLWKASQYYG